MLFKSVRQASRKNGSDLDALKQWAFRRRARAARVEALEARRLLAGDLDHSFGGDGQTTVDFGQGREEAAAVVAQPDGKILVAGTFRSDAILLRYDADGSPDGSFATGGVVRFSRGEASSFGEILVLPDGKILAGGGNGAGQYVLARFHPNGTLDTSFGGGDGLFYGAGTVASTER